MNEYLHFHCGPHQLLVDLAHVVEVGDRPDDATCQGWRPWREHNLPLLDFCAFLGVPAATGRRQQIVLRRDDGGCGVIDVDAVERLLPLPPPRFATVASLSERLQALVDAVAVDDATGSCLLRLRHPFAWINKDNEPEPAP